MASQDLRRQIALLNLRNLCSKFDRDIYDDGLLNKFLRSDLSFYSDDEIRYLERYLTSSNDGVINGVLRALCAYGINISEYEYLLENNANTALFATFVDIAVKQKNADVLLNLLDEESGHMVKVVLALKAIGREDLLTPLLFSDNDEVVATILKLTGNGK